MLLYFARHGESEANVLHIMANEVGTYHLTERGRDEAKDLAEYIACETVDRMYASPILRAQETAQIVAERTGLTFETRPELREFSVGCFEGVCDPKGWEEYREVEDAWMVDGDHSARVGGGECYEDIKARFLPLIQELTDEFGATDTKILLLGHGGTFCSMLPLILANVDVEFVRQHRMAPASAVKARYCGDGKFECISWGAVPVTVCS